MKTLRMVALLALLFAPLTAGAATSADEALAGLVASLNDAGLPAGRQPDEQVLAPLLERLLPHLGAPSQRMVESMLGAARAARQHDETARAAFGPALARQEGYTPAAGALASFVAFALPLASLQQGSAAEIVERSADGEEVAYRVRWLSAAGGERQSVEESLVAVREGGAWKLLLPGFGSLTFGSRTRSSQTENYVERQKKPRTAGAMREESEATRQKIERLAGLFRSLTDEVKAGRFQTPKAYVEAIAARAQRM